MNLRQFNNTVCALKNIDRDELEFAIGGVDQSEWNLFSRQPTEWLTHASDEKAAKVFEMVQRRVRVAA